jgi:hypothetical protein
MSETSVAVEAPQVPVESTESVDTSQASEQATPETKTVSDIKMGARQRLAEKFNEAMAEQGSEETDTTTATDRMRQPKGSPKGGQFMKQEETEEASEETPPESSASDASEEVPETETASASEAVEEGAAETEQAITTPEGTVTVPVADDHPLRQRGREAFKVSPEDERDIRALLNSHTRRSELDAMENQLHDTNAQLLESRASAEYWKERASSGGLLTKEQEQAYQDILGTYGEADAENYRNGIMANLQTEGLDQKVQEARLTHSQQVAADKAAKFARDAINDAMVGNPTNNVKAQYPLWSETEVRQALSGYGALCQAQNAMPTPNGWYKYADAVYNSNERVRTETEMRKATENSRIAKTAKAKATEEARAAEEQRLQEAANRHSTRPKGVASTLTAGVRDKGTSDQNESLRFMSPGQQKRARRSRVRTWGQNAQ